MHCQRVLVNKFRIQSFIVIKDIYKFNSVFFTSFLNMTVPSFSDLLCSLMLFLDQILVNNNSLKSVIF